MQHIRFLSPQAASALLGLSLSCLTFACGPAVATVPTPVAADPFVVVRAKSEAAYVSGRAHLDRGELQAALIDLDTAKTNDPDSRQDIQQAIAQTLSQLALQTPTAEPTPVPRTIVVATVAAAARPASVATPAPAATAPAAAVAARPTSASVVGPTPAAAATHVNSSPTLVAWRDPQGRFSLSAPVDWARAQQPQSLFGTSVVQFRDPSGQAEFDVAVAGATRAVSPELYAATMELAMQQQVPGYAAEQTQPGSTAGNPSVRRVFTFFRRDAAGNDSQTRGFQVAVVKGSTPYLISGSAPADQFEAFSLTFDQMVETFRFS